MGLAKNPSISADEARALLQYDAETGALRWRVDRMTGRHHAIPKAKAGDLAGCRQRDGILLRINRKAIRAHRIIWLIVTGEWPSQYIDHINGDPCDNRWINLRPATPQQNQCNRRMAANNTSGFKGIWFNKNEQKWVANISTHGRKHSLGYFDTKEAAYAAYCSAAEKLHGEFANLGEVA